MFRKILLLSISLGLCICPGKLHAEDDVFIEATAAYFYPMDHKFREIYSGGGIYGTEITFKTYRKLYGWISGDWFDKEGSSLGTHRSTRITLVPLGIGLKYLFPTKRVDYYLGAGALTTYLHINDHSPFVFQSVRKWGIGGIAKTGAIIKLSKHFLADLFTTYSYTEIDFHRTNNGKIIRHTANLSGWTFGLGIGCRFGCPN